MCSGPTSSPPLQSFCLYCTPKLPICLLVCYAGAHVFLSFSLCLDCYWSWPRWRQTFFVPSTVDSSLQGVYFGGNSSAAAAAAASQMSNQILIEFNQIYYFRFEFLKNHLNSSLMLTNFELARNQKTSSQISMGFRRNCISWLDTLL